MKSSEPRPSLPNWLFVVTDLALIGAAAVIAFRSSQPLSSNAVLWIVGLVGFGAVVGLVPIIVRFERQKNETLDDRQRALETLSQTVASSAEQISIATGSLHDIAELAQKNLRQAEHLPHKLQEKIAEFQAQLAEANDTEKEELEKELVDLRASESERLESIASKIAKSAAEWTKLEAAVAHHLAAAQDAVAKLPAGTAAAIEKAQNSADQALAESRLAAARTIADAEGQATRTIVEAGGQATRTIADAGGQAARGIAEAGHQAARAIVDAEAGAARTIAAAQAAALIALDARLADLEARLVGATSASSEKAAGDLRQTVATAVRSLDEKLAQLETLAQRLEAVAAKIPASPAPVLAPPPADPIPMPTPIEVSLPAAAATDPVEPSEPAASPAPKRPRRAKKEESGAVESAPAAVIAEVVPAPAPEPAPLPATPAAPAEPEPTPAAVPAAEAIPIVTPEVTVTATAAEPATEPAATSEVLSPALEPAPIPADSIAEVAPVAPSTHEPFARFEEDPPAVPPPAVPEEVPAPPAVSPEPSPTSPAPELETPPALPKKRTTRKVEPMPDPSLDLPLEDIPTTAPSAAVERTLTSDGATRLLATAYIGIGNRLYIRGDGPGLSWEKGVALQFVSIGKWRWETNDATAPIRFRLYKNDDLECTALGEQILEPGHLQEMNATF